MSAEDFFSRWSKPKQLEVEQSESFASDEISATHSEISKQADVADLAKIPTMEDVNQLHDESDFSVFLKGGVDEDVKRSAMKKLFSNPHFNVMDGLDIYISDYGKPDPMPLGMLEALLHGKALLNPLEHLRQQFHQMLSPIEVKPSVPLALFEPTSSDLIESTDVNCAAALTPEVVVGDALSVQPNTDQDQVSNNNDIERTPNQV